MLHMSREMPARRGAHFVPNVLENFSCKNHENVVYQELKHLDDIIFRVLVFLVKVSLYKYASW